MSILDRLKQERAEKEKQAESMLTADKDNNWRYLNLTIPTMQNIYSYMSEVVEHLNALSSRIEISNYTDRYPQLARVVQTKYSISTNNSGLTNRTENIESIYIKYLCQAPEKFAYLVEGQRYIDREIEFLRSRNLSFDWSYSATGGVANRSAKFILEPSIPASFNFGIHEDMASIFLLIINHEDLRSYKLLMNPEDISEQFLDSLVRLLLREDDIMSHHNKYKTKMLSTF